MKIIEIIEKQPQNVLDTYESSETNILEQLKMKKTENSKEFGDSTNLTSIILWHKAGPKTT